MTPLITWRRKWPCRLPWGYKGQGILAKLDAERERLRYGSLAHTWINIDRRVWELTQGEE